MPYDDFFSDFPPENTQDLFDTLIPPLDWPDAGEPLVGADNTALSDDPEQTAPVCLSNTTAMDSLPDNLEDDTEAPDPLFFLDLEQSLLLPLPDRTPTSPEYEVNNSTQLPDVFVAPRPRQKREPGQNVSRPISTKPEKQFIWTECVFTQRGKRARGSEEASDSSSFASSSSAPKNQRTASGKNTISYVRNDACTSTYSADTAHQYSSFPPSLPSLGVNNVFSNVVLQPDAPVILDGQQKLTHAPIDRVVISDRSPEVFILPPVTTLLGASPPTLNGPILSRYVRSLDDVDRCTAQPDTLSQRCEESVASEEVWVASRTFNMFSMSEKKRMALIQNLAKYNISEKTYLKACANLSALGYSTAEIRKLVPGLGWLTTVNNLVNKHELIMGLIKRDGLSHKDLIKVCTCEDGNQNLDGLVHYYAELKVLGYPPQSIMEMVSRTNGAEHLDMVRKNHNTLIDYRFKIAEIVGMASRDDGLEIIPALIDSYQILEEGGLNNRDIIQIACVQDGARKLRIVKEFFSRVPSVMIATGIIKEIVTTTPIKNILQNLIRKQEQMESKEAQTILRSVQPLERLVNAKDDTRAACAVSSPVSVSVSMSDFVVESAGSSSSRPPRRPVDKPVEREATWTDQTYRKCGFHQDAYKLYRAVLISLGYEEGSINSIFLGAGKHGAVDALIAMHDTLINLVKKNGLDHKDLALVSACPDGAQNLMALMKHYTTLRSQGYSNRDIIGVLSHRNGAVNLERVRAKHDELVSLGFKTADIISMASHHCGARRLEIIAEFFKKAPDIKIPNRRIAELVANNPTEKLFQALETEHAHSPNEIVILSSSQVSDTGSAMPRQSSGSSVSSSLLAGQSSFFRSQPSVSGSSTVEPGNRNEPDMNLFDRIG
ncbi:hypothetical protein [Legionella bononiensis]|uniref:Avirulence protein AvrBs3 n=1 Tax=Legionella bononiensis TaxID=2793102 RepID=A0ABS1WDY1_9GAMM|nr:hypothetical protein [Legionella bononiensis]MBL7479565.1 hypothetical protein [Legionella bononiensis]MBL7527560.1 hypothetical protein [Legionella bononiensis]